MYEIYQVIHVCGQEKLFHCQKVSLAWRSLTTEETAIAGNQVC